jgi:hypothetical protein
MTGHTSGARVGKRPSHSSAATPSIARMVMLLVGLVILVVALPPFFDFPWLRFWLLPLAAIYLFLLMILPRLWLFALPLATVGLDIAPFTGRFIYNELDLVFLVTLASGLLSGRYRVMVFNPGPTTIVLFCYLVVIALGYSGWKYFLLTPGTEFDNPYYTSEYAYRAIKGMVWGIALVPMWGYQLAVDKPRSVNALVAGMSAAALLLGLIVLWERGTVGVMLSGLAWYHWLSSLLDLSSSYRATGIFSSMHTGGEAFDGVVLLLLPATLYAATYGRAVWLRVLGALGLLTLAYVTLMGFTLATYCAFIIAIMLYAFFTFRARRSNGMSFSIPLVDTGVAMAVCTLAAVLAYRFAGSHGLASYGVLLALAYGAKRVQLPPWTTHVITGLAVLCVVFAVSAHIRGVWVEASFGGALVIALGLVASYVCACRLFEKTGATAELDRLFLLAGIVLLPALIAFALAGYQINDRESRAAGDLENRESLWKNVISSSDDGVWRGLFGNGTGSFPGNYIKQYPEYVKNVGSFKITREQNRDVLRLVGGRDLKLGQRVSIDPYTNYTVNIHLRAEQGASFEIGLCERNLIYTGNVMPRCVFERLAFDATDGAFEQYSMEINSASIAEQGSLRRWPTVMTLNYDKPDSVVEIDAIDLSRDGFNILQNTSFKRGLDYWFPYSDFFHRPWHIQNTYLQVWYESGWLGFGLLLVLVALLVQKNFQRHAHDSLLPAYTTGVLTICVFGLFGSPLEAARVSWMFYFFLAAGLANLRRQPRSPGR